MAFYGIPLPSLPAPLDLLAHVLQLLDHLLNLTSNEGREKSSKCFACSSGSSFLSTWKDAMERVAGRRRELAGEGLLRVTRSRGQQVSDELFTRKFVVSWGVELGRDQRRLSKPTI